MAEWNDNTVLSNFRDLRAGQFDFLRNEFGIKLSDETLTACAIQCALVLRRDPTIGELRLWERLANLSAPLAEATLSVLETESAAIAETYADMMAKRRDLSASVFSPSLSDLFSLATDTLERGGKERGSRSAALRLTDLIDAPAADSGIAEANAPAFLSVLARRSTVFCPETDDICLLVDRGDLSQYAFLEKRASLLESDSLFAKLHGAFPIPKTGLLPAMLAHFDGFTIDLSRLGQPSLPSPEILVGAFGGDWVLILPKSTARDALEKLLDLGMKGFSFATLTGNRKITILGETRLTENADFLRSLIRPCPELSLVLQATAPTAPTISHHPQSGYFCPFLPTSKAFSETFEISGMQASSASARLTEGAFSTVILTALAPILACALSGAGYSEMRLAVDLALPMRGFTALPASFAASIGLYRVQAELGIPAAQTRISEKEINAPILSVFSAGKGIKTPAGTLRGADSKVYLIPVQLSSEGLPDFAALRLLLADLCAQAKNDVIRSARLVLQKAPKTVLTEMQSETLRATPTVSPEKLSEPLPLGILLESIYEMPFEQVATVSVCKAASVNPVKTPDPFRIPEGNGLIPREKPEAVLYAPADCPDAIAIARFLRQRDIFVSIFDPREKESFLRAVLTASVVYRLPGATLPKGKKADFAFSVLRQNGGEIRSLKQIRCKKAVRS